MIKKILKFFIKFIPVKSWRKSLRKSINESSSNFNFKFIGVDLKVLYYKKFLSNCKNIQCSGKCGTAGLIIDQPVLFLGEGRINIGNNVQFGCRGSSHFYNGYCFLKADKDALVEIGDNTVINNNFVIVAQYGKITIGKDCLIGTGVEIFSSESHRIEPKNRRWDYRDLLYKDVSIGNNVWIGNNVTILKGVTIGDNSIIGVASVVTKNIPANCIAVGVPAKVVKFL